MKIELFDTTPLAGVEVGECFLYNGEPHIRNDDRHGNFIAIVCLSSGELDDLNVDTVVTPLLLKVTNGD